MPAEKIYMWKSSVPVFMINALRALYLCLHSANTNECQDDSDTPLALETEPQTTQSSAHFELMNVTCMGQGVGGLKGRSLK